MRFFFKRKCRVHFRDLNCEIRLVKCGIFTLGIQRSDGESLFLFEIDFLSVMNFDFFYSFLRLRIC
ncbi:hypothetical protein LEP1GSC151_2558 [Leptospira interrogans serovar Grippotyphosa str. LT2186]|uniref:Uncharacterized protein n=1 Tax=Leptospira interrogans serovar Grippotyphosa str. LT2186 TaxID=1001599 RepID=M3HZ59_LEPIR|nr:hypothetical protein LEP1GSC019_2617 [Leptospira interrogans serovar Pyrogenes str. 2006006960]EKR33946.1 hypothetical protein LEP1GSC096_1969 [Leptospira interrogans serovar Hebdomadis str. R499]EMG08962.1 hypothetical protein LEP1GSC151_2558 [Leptospira interrogans serovar Grippotyphosa str. LT2186]EMN97679.1 hypothetical protein LEP1GSC112_1087 [Leptospira interrogans serovar Pomona str. UT364]